MEKTLNEYIVAYKKQLEKGDIQQAYKGLLKYIFTVKSHLSKKMCEFTFGNTSQGYMDYTYIPFFNDYLKSNNLRFGIVLNHRKIRFELWLMGQNAKVQEKYWGMLKDTEWNKNRTIMPKYSVLEVTLVENPNFDDLETLTQEIEKRVFLFSKDIIAYLKRIKAWQRSLSGF